MKRASAVETFQIKLLLKKRKLLWQLYVILKKRSTTINLDLKITVAAITKKSKNFFLKFKFQVLCLDKVFFKNRGIPYVSNS